MTRDVVFIEEAVRYIQTKTNHHSQGCSPFQIVLDFFSVLVIESGYLLVEDTILFIDPGDIIILDILAFPRSSFPFFNSNLKVSSQFTTTRILIPSLTVSLYLGRDDPLPLWKVCHPQQHNLGRSPKLGYRPDLHHYEWPFR